MTSQPSGISCAIKTNPKINFFFLEGGNRRVCRVCHKKFAWCWASANITVKHIPPAHKVARTLSQNTCVFYALSRCIQSLLLFAIWGRMAHKTSQCYIFRCVFPLLLLAFLFPLPSLNGPHDEETTEVREKSEVLLFASNNKKQTIEFTLFIELSLSFDFWYFKLSVYPTTEWKRIKKRSRKYFL